MQLLQPEFLTSSPTIPIEILHYISTYTTPPTFLTLITSCPTLYRYLSTHNYLVVYKAQYLQTIEKIDDYNCRIIETIRKDTGQRHGRYLEYYECGNLFADYNYKNGRFHGRYLEYYGNGNLWLDCSYKNGMRHGKYFSYYSNGRLLVDSNYVDGKRHGKYAEYFKNGQLWEESIYESGKYCGEYRYYSNGNL